VRLQKSKSGTNAGAIAVIVVNNAAGEVMSGADESITIPRYK
jgi:hypothetical protein